MGQWFELVTTLQGPSQIHTIRVFLLYDLHGDLTGEAVQDSTQVVDGKEWWGNFADGDLATEMIKTLQFCSLLLKYFRLHSPSQQLNITK